MERRIVLFFGILVFILAGCFNNVEKEAKEIEQNNDTVEAFAVAATTTLPKIITVTGITIDKTTLTLNLGATTTVSIKVLPENATDKTVTWTSSNKAVATVVNGVITAVGAGTTTITVTTNGVKFTKTIAVKVIQLIKVTGVTADKMTLNLYIGTTSTVAIKVLPENATDKTVVWTTSNKAVATVLNGTITATGAGSATITVTTNDGKFTKAITVTGMIKVTGVTVEKTTLSLNVGANTTVAIKVLPDNANDKSVVWGTSNKAVATVSNGAITAVAVGSAIVTVSTNDGKFSKSITVTVTKAATVSTGISNTQYTLEQAMSDNAQLTTIAFSGLAFITGSAGADTFMPPGKVADFFGFQYMRDVDTAGYGHNTTFLSRVANNVLYILNDAQKAKLVALAKEQAPLYTNFAYNRFPIMNAFRRSLESKGPTATSTLNIQTVSQYTAALYKTDADLSYNRAIVVGGIIQSFTDTQKAYLAKMQFNNYLSWPAVAEDETLKKGMDDTQFVAVMTYASELFSWYKGSLTADIYFCPERHGTYFGGFFMKDYPAMNNPSYFISTSITGDSGKEFLNVLTTSQRALVTGIITEQKAALTEIAQIRTTVSTELRKAMSGGTVDKAKVYTLIGRYGALDGQISALYATRFSAVNKTLTSTQRAALIKLRNLSVVPTGAYRFATPVAMPTIASTDYMFGVGTLPTGAGQTTAPVSFGITTVSK